MTRLAWRSAPLLIFAVMIVSGGAAVAGGAALLAASSHGAGAVHGAVKATRPGTPANRPAHVVIARQVAPLRRIVPPDLLVVSRDGITRADVTRLRRLAYVRDVITVAGGAIRLRAHRANVLGVDPSAFRSWTPLTTAADERIWAALARNEFVLSTSAEARLRLRAGQRYQMAGATQPVVTMGAAAALGVPGVDALVSMDTARTLGLLPRIAAMINAPGADVATLSGQVRELLGNRSQIVDLLPEARQVLSGTGSAAARPTTYLALYQESAARYCPGLSWTVLAAIGQIESGHGVNDGPSTAGALGPMQFLPSTWRTWGIPGFGDTTADIMNPYDAVPSAARYLCANGAAAGGQSLYRAVYAYNHADWYVREVLVLAQEYGRQFG